MGMDQINHLKAELMKTQNDNAELHKLLNTLQEETKENKLTIERITGENIELRQGRDKTRESEDDEDEMDDDDKETPDLIKELQEKPISEFESLQTDADFVEERIAFYQTDDNMVWKNKALESEEKVIGLEIQRKASFEEIDTLTQTVRALQAEHESHIQQYKNEVAEFKKKHKESEKIRRSSVAALHDNLFAKLSEAEAEHEEISADYKQIIGKLQKANTAYAKQLLVNNVEIGKLKLELHDLQATKANELSEHESIIEEYKNEIAKFKKSTKSKREYAEVRFLHC